MDAEAQVQHMGDPGGTSAGERGTQPEPVDGSAPGQARADAPVLVVGGTGTVGAPVVRGLREAGATVRVAARSASGPDAVRLDLTDSATWDAAFTGVSTMFLVRPPQLGNVRRDVVPALQRARDLGMQHVVLLSVQNAERMPFVPHAVLEKWLLTSGMSHTFLRPAYFDQNLTAALAPDIRERSTIVVPGGRAPLAFVDAEDIAEMAVAALLDPTAHAGEAYTPATEALTWAQVAETLSQVLGRRVSYQPMSVPAFLRHCQRDLGMQRAEAVVTTAIHASARLGRSAGLTDDVQRVTGHRPRTLREFIEREAGAWA